LPPEKSPAALTLPDTFGLAPEALQPFKLTFEPFFTQVADWRHKASMIKITDSGQKRDMQMARASRLALRDLRIQVEAKRKSLKEEHLRVGRAIDGFAAIVTNEIAPIEQYLKEQEDFAVRLEEQRKDEIRAVRRAAIATYQPEMAIQSQGFDLAGMSDDQWNSYLEGARIRFEKAQEKARLEEEERQRKLAEEAAERERVRVENERLKKEAQEREAAAKAEREAAAARQAELEAQAAKERAEAEAEKEKILAKHRADAEKARRLKEAVDQKAAEERAVLEAKAKAERERAEAAEKELAAKAKAEKEEAARKEREAAKARRAPDKAKLLTFAANLQALAEPELVTPVAQEIGDELHQRISDLAVWIAREANTL
jgi:hypothetical protein